MGYLKGYHFGDTEELKNAASLPPSQLSVRGMIRKERLANQLSLNVGKAKREYPELIARREERRGKLARRLLSLLSKPSPLNDYEKAEKSRLVSRLKTEDRSVLQGYLAQYKRSLELDASGGLGTNIYGDELGTNIYGEDVSHLGFSVGGAFKKIGKGIAKVAKGTAKVTGKVVKGTAKAVAKTAKVTAKGTALVGKGAFKATKAVVKNPITRNLGRVGLGIVTGGQSELVIQAASLARNPKQGLKGLAKGALSSVTGGASDVAFNAGSAALAIKKGGVKGLARQGLSYATGGESERIVGSVKSTASGLVPQSVKSTVKQAKAVKAKTQAKAAAVRSAVPVPPPATKKAASIAKKAAVVRRSPTYSPAATLPSEPVYTEEVVSEELPSEEYPWASEDYVSEEVPEGEPLTEQDQMDENMSGYELDGFGSEKRPRYIRAFNKKRKGAESAPMVEARSQKTSGLRVRGLMGENFALEGFGAAPAPLSRAQREKAIRDLEAWKKKPGVTRVQMLDLDRRIAGHKAALKTMSAVPTKKVVAPKKPVAAVKKPVTPKVASAVKSVTKSLAAKPAASAAPSSRAQHEKALRDLEAWKKKPGLTAAQHKDLDMRIAKHKSALGKPSPVSAVKKAVASVKAPKPIAAVKKAVAPVKKAVAAATAAPKPSASSKSTHEKAIADLLAWKKKAGLTAAQIKDLDNRIAKHKAALGVPAASKKPPGVLSMTKKRLDNVKAAAKPRVAAAKTKAYQAAIAKVKAQSGGVVTERDIQEATAIASTAGMNEERKIQTEIAQLEEQADYEMQASDGVVIGRSGPDKPGVTIPAEDHAENMEEAGKPSEEESVEAASEASVPSKIGPVQIGLAALAVVGLLLMMKKKKGQAALSAA